MFLKWEEIFRVSWE